MCSLPSIADSSPSRSHNSSDDDQDLRSKIQMLRAMADEIITGKTLKPTMPPQSVKPTRRHLRRKLKGSHSQCIRNSHFISTLPLSFATAEYWDLTDAIARQDAWHRGETIPEEVENLGINGLGSDGFERMYLDAIQHQEPDLEREMTIRRRFGPKTRRKTLGTVDAQYGDTFQVLRQGPKTTHDRQLCDPLSVPLSQYVVAQLRAVRFSAERGYYYHRVFNAHASGLRRAQKDILNKTIKESRNVNYIGANQEAVAGSGPNRVLAARINRKKQLEQRNETEDNELFSWFSAQLELRRHLFESRKRLNDDTGDDVFSLVAKRWSTHIANALFAETMLDALLEQRQRRRDLMDEQEEQRGGCQQLTVQQKSRAWVTVRNALKGHVIRYKQKRYAVPIDLIRRFLRHFRQMNRFVGALNDYREDVKKVQRQVRNFFRMREARRTLVTMQWIVQECHQLRIEHPIRRALNYSGKPLDTIALNSYMMERSRIRSVHSVDEIMYVPLGGCTIDMRYANVCREVTKLIRLRASQRMQYCKLMAFYVVENAKYRWNMDENAGVPPPELPTAPIYHLLAERKELTLLVRDELSKVSKRPTRISLRDDLGIGPGRPSQSPQPRGLPAGEGTSSLFLPPSNLRIEHPTSKRNSIVDFVGEFSPSVGGHDRMSRMIISSKVGPPSPNKVYLKSQKEYDLRRALRKLRKKSDAAVGQGALGRDPKCTVRSDAEYAEMLSMPSVDAMRQWIQPDGRDGARGVIYRAPCKPTIEKPPRGECLPLQLSALAAKKRELDVEGANAVFDTPVVRRYGHRPQDKLAALTARGVDHHDEMAHHTGGGVASSARPLPARKFPRPPPIVKQPLHEEERVHPVNFQFVPPARGSVKEHVASSTDVAFPAVAMLMASARFKRNRHSSPMHDA